MFIPVHPRISVDMGNNFKVEHISVSGKDRCLKFSAKALITPIPKMKLNYKQQKESFLADFHVDAGMCLCFHLLTYIKCLLNCSIFDPFKYALTNFFLNIFI